MSTTSVVLNHILPLDAVDLGRLVLNVKEPSQGFYQPESLPRDIVNQRLEAFSEVLSQVKESRLHGFLTTAFTAAFATQRESTALIKSSACITRQLQNSDDYFHELCSLATARDWLERALRRNRPVFLVVGIKTLTDATVVQMEGCLRETSIDFKVPVAAAATGVGLPLPIVGDVVDPGAGKSRLRRLDAESWVFAPGEQIYAVQYRKVEFSRFSRRNVDKSWLESGNRWKAYVGLRAAGADDENDGIEVCLSGIQQGQLPGVEVENCERVELEGEELLYFWN